MVWLIDFIYPKKCFGCGAKGSYFCKSCQLKSPKPKMVCPSCDRLSIGGWRHGCCGGDLERLIVGMKYRGIVSLGLRRVKFGSNWAILDDLFEWWWKEIGEKLRKLQAEEWVISWIPMYEVKKKKRGFDQAEILAKKLGERLGFEVIGLLKRSRLTQPQFGLGIKERQKNLKGAFKIESEAKEVVLKKKVLLVDDIWTTGSTMREGGKVLRENGFEKIWGVVVAG